MKRSEVYRIEIVVAYNPEHDEWSWSASGKGPDGRLLGGGTGLWTSKAALREAGAAIQRYRIAEIK
jgi:hypothetical protein